MDNKVRIKKYFEIKKPLWLYIDSVAVSISDSHKGDFFFVVKC